LILANNEANSNSHILKPDQAAGCSCSKGRLLIVIGHKICGTETIFILSTRFIVKRNYVQPIEQLEGSYKVQFIITFLYIDSEIFTRL
jgi:hypothetical protein